MFISELKISNFRKHSRFKTNLTEKINVIVGPNSSGKTSLLEAIYVQKNKKSFRNKNIISDTKNISKVTTILSKNNKKLATNTEISQKNIKSENTPYTVTLFSPQFSNELFNSPETRRNIVDYLIKQIHPKYEKDLNEYNKILEHRNNVLKKYSKKQANQKEYEMIKIFNSLFLEKSLQISLKRQEYINKINQLISQYFEKLTLKSKKIKVEFIPNPKILTKQHFKEQIISNFEKEKILGYTLEGCQKDDFVVYKENQLFKDVASQGDLWAFAYCFVICEHKIIKELTQQSLNILLLDDLFISLDKERKKRVLELIKNEDQTIITTTEKVKPTKNIPINIIEIA